MTPWEQKKLSFKITRKKELLSKLQESYDWHNKQAMGTEGGENKCHEEEVISLLNLIKELEQDIKFLERDLINNS